MSKREYGTGSIYYLESRNRWVAQYRVGIGPDGKVKKSQYREKQKKKSRTNYESYKLR